MNKRFNIFTCSEDQFVKLFLYGIGVALFIVISAFTMVEIRNYIETKYLSTNSVASTDTPLINNVHDDSNNSTTTVVNQSTGIDFIKSGYYRVTKETLQEFMERQNYKLFPELTTIIINGVFEASQKYNVPAIILLSLMSVESNFEYTSVSKTGAIGLFQISKIWLDPTWDKSLVSKGLVKHKKDLYNPKVNIMCGAYIMRYYMDMGEHKKDSNPIKFSLTKYLGGDKNEHYTNVLNIIGEYHVFTLLKAMKGLKNNANA